MHVAQLPHVAGPTVFGELRAGRVGEAQARAAVQAAEMVEEEIDEQADVVAPIAERRADTARTR